MRGQLYKAYDGAGVTEIDLYDFKGNPKTSNRTYTVDATQNPDWTTIGSVALEDSGHVTSFDYDALSRPVSVITPDSGITRYEYDKGGLLKTVALEGVYGLTTGIVNNISHDAKGQRQKLQQQNGATTTYEYDAYTFRLRKIRTTRSSDSALLQDLRYWYDPVGNIPCWRTNPFVCH